MLPQWTTALHSHSLCGDNNLAFFGSCLASTGKRLEMQLLFSKPVNPGLTFAVSVWKLDFYNQTVTSDSNTFLKIQTEPSASNFRGGPGLLLAAEVSGQAVFQLVCGNATLAVAVQPYIAEIKADSGLTFLASEAVLYAEGFDNQSSAYLRCVSRHSKQFLCQLHNDLFFSFTSDLQVACNACCPWCWCQYLSKGLYSGS